MNKLQLQGIGMTSQRTRSRLVQRLKEQGINDQQVLDIMGNTPRHIFIDEALSHRAYEDTALPIGFNQTISQPYIVARMTEILLADGPLERVLEVGTGSGYQTAILASLFKQVVSLERISSFQPKAKERFQALELSNIELHHADGYEGWDAKAPFDAILVTAAPASVPPKLVSQLSETGVMVLPVGEGEEQSLTRVTRNEFGHTSDVIAPVHFVPLQQGVV